MQLPHPISSLDALRQQHPELGFAVYAYTPGGAVTLEVLTPDGSTFEFKAETLDQAVAMAFPESPPAAPETDIFD